MSLATERPDGSSDAAEILPKADEVTQHLAGEDRGALQQRVVFTGARLHGSGENGATQRGGRMPREGGVNASDRLKHMGVRGTDPWEAELLRQPLDPRTREGSEQSTIQHARLRFFVGALGRSSLHRPQLLG